MSALPPEADIFRGGSDVRFVPKADIGTLMNAKGGCYLEDAKRERRPHI